MGSKFKMFTREDLDSWNELFPGCKIFEHELMKPTEAMLTRLLVAYLRNFGYKLEPPSLEAQDYVREKRLFLVKLASNIDRIQKITDQSFTFYYYDLVQPSPKKTSHILSILLNYLYFYNMYKTEIFERINIILKTRKQLLEKINNAKTNITNVKAKIIKIKNTIAELREMLPQLKTEINTSKLRKSELQKQTKTLKETLKALQTATDDLKTQLYNLKKQLVPDAEIINLKHQVNDLNEIIGELQLRKETINKSVKENDVALTEMENLKKAIERCKHDFPTKMLQDYQKSKTLCQEAELSLQTLKNERHTLRKQIEDQLVLFENKLPQILTQINEEKRNQLQMIDIKKKEMSECIAQLDDLEVQENALTQSLNTQKSVNSELNVLLLELFQGHI